MKPAAAVLAIVLFSLSAAAEEPSTQGLPPMHLGVAGQFAWQYVQPDDGADTNEIQAFQTRRFHVYFGGEPVPGVEWALGLELAGDSIAATPYEAYINLRPDPRFGLKIGTFLPPWTLDMPKPIHSLDFIRYPLLVDNNLTLFTPWRQNGLMASYTPGDTFTLSAGLFSGLIEANSFGELNNMTDTMVAVHFSFTPGLVFHFGHWGGKATYNTGAVDYSLIWVGATFAKDAWLLSAEEVWERSSGDFGNPSSQGFQVSSVYSFGLLQAVARYELLEPDTSDSGTGADDEREWTTIGLNFLLTENAKLMADYIFKAERQNNQRDNDEILLQFSFAF
jgi:hypothetical protein